LFSVAGSIGFFSAAKVRHAVKAAPRYWPLAALQH
jgi:hypothetical protein